MRDRGVLQMRRWSSPTAAASKLLDDTLDAVADDGTPVIRVFDQVADGGDPHVWFDPTLVASRGGHRRRVVAAGADEAATQSASGVRGVMEALDAEVADILAAVPPEAAPPRGQPRRARLLRRPLRVRDRRQRAARHLDAGRGLPAELERLAAEIESTARRRSSPKRCRPPRRRRSPTTSASTS